RTTGALAAGALAALLAGTIAAPASSQPGGPGTGPGAGPAVGPATTPATTPNPADPTDGTDAVEGSRWTLANLPDTQFYSRYAADQFEPRYGSNPYLAQTEWLADVHDELNIPFVTHVGDVVDRAGVENEWAAADAAHRVLEEAGLPYSILPGNHDLTNSGANDTELGPDEPYLQWFTPERSAAQSPNSGRDATGFSEYHVFEAEGQEYLVLSLAWRTSDETLEWADQVMADHPTLPTILVSHEILGVDSDGVTAVTGGNGQRLWDGLIHDNDQIFLTLSGHNHGSTHRVVENDNGQEVIQVLQDWQMHYEGGNGYLGLLEFDLDNDAIHVSAPSPWVVGKPEDALTMHDRPMLEAENEEYSVAIDFEERFAGFNPDWEPGDGADTSLTERARALILDGFDGVPPVDRDVPGSTEDFVRTEGTVAHWRPNLVDAEIGDVLPEGAVLPDAVLEEQAMTRGPISTSPTAQEEDVTLCEGHAFSSSASGICFANSSNSDNRFSYFATESDVPVTDVEFDDGYTIEAFINIAEGWTAEENAWTRALARSGNRSRIPGMAQIWDYEQAPASIGFSNLREFQWTVVPEDPTTGDRTAWSGEITSDDWYHLAMVNDPEDGSVTMYVDGMPILRNISDGNGMSFEEGYPWMIGAGTNDDVIGSGWHGGVGEVRVIDRATEPGEWLIDRPDVAAFTAPTAELESGDDGTVPALTGTGQAGATVVATGALTGEAVVAEDGSWTLEGALADPTASGTHEFSLTHGFGERRSEAVAGQVTVPGETEEPGETEPGEPEPGEPTPPTAGRGFYLNDGWDANAEHEFSYGRVGDEVLVGDWDGDGADTLAVRRGITFFVNN
ncbi:MAG: LamG-like jellyroll fold domain-containing protein, partial [Actinomycetaceae bacterium]